MGEDRHLQRHARGVIQQELLVQMPGSEGHHPPFLRTTKSASPFTSRHRKVAVGTCGGGLQGGGEN